VQGSEWLLLLLLLLLLGKVLVKEFLKICLEIYSFLLIANFISLMVW